MDVYNAFDLVLHEHLLLKIQKYGINGQIRIGIRAYPENRKQKVVIRGFEFVFVVLILIHDLPKCVNYLVCLFSESTYN